MNSGNERGLFLAPCATELNSTNGAWQKDLISKWPFECKAKIQTNNELIQLN